MLRWLLFPEPSALPSPLAERKGLGWEMREGRAARDGVQKRKERVNWAVFRIRRAVGLFSEPLKRLSRECNITLTINGA